MHEDNREDPDRATTIPLDSAPERDIADCVLASHYLVSCRNGGHISVAVRLGSRLCRGLFVLVCRGAIELLSEPFLLRPGLLYVEARRVRGARGEIGRATIIVKRWGAVT